ncbi:MAG: murein biosynthesis integral membrane protein MurJ [Pseudomonadota bacterium]|nr:murein biosynthesis integral membrane protein MurJ [Pseudomonadota bacterium]
MALLRSAATVGSLTLASRFLGFGRDVLIANAIGTGLVAQAFVVAFRFPNLFRNLFAEGAFNSAFVPLFAKRLEAHGPANAQAFAEDVMSVLFAWVLLFVAVAVLAMPLLIYAIAWGFAGDQEKLDLSVGLARVAFPYLLFMSLAALLSGVLNSTHRFAAAAAAPILLNLTLIVALLIANIAGWGDDERTGYALVTGVFIAGVAQFALLWMAAARAGFALRLGLPRLSNDVRRLVALAVPGLIAGGITQFNLLVATQIASSFDRAVSYLYYADRIYQLPLGVVGVAIGVVLLPDLSRKLRTNNSSDAIISQNRALELALFLTIPAAIAIITAADPIIRTIFEHGAFTRSDSYATSSALTAFAVGLPAFVMIKVFAPGFFAREDTRTPMKYAIVSVAVNLVSALILSRFFRHVGIAAATAIAAWVNTSALALTLALRGQFAPDERLRWRLTRIIAAAILMGVLLVAGRYAAGDAFTGEGSRLARVSALAALVGMGAGAYFAAAHFLGAMTWGELKETLRQRR